MSKLISPIWDVIVIGGGAAGFFAAIRAAEQNQNLRVLILEKASQTLGKVLISGGGRCNVTHACFEPAKLITYYPRGGNELRGAFTRFQPKDTVQWFEARNVKLKTESDGRMFPITDDSNTIAHCLRDAAKQAGVRVELGASVLGVEKTLQGGFKLEVQKEAKAFSLHTKKLMFATGGDRKSQQLIQKLGHTIVPQVPSLFTFNIKDKRIHDLAGVSVEDVNLKVEGLTARGPLLVTHWGMSDRLGPMSFRIGEEHVFLGKEIQEARDFSEETATVIDEEVQRILRDADQRAYELLEGHRPELDRLVEVLLQKEEIYREEMEEVLGPRKSPLDGQPGPNTAVFAPGSAK